MASEDDAQLDNPVYSALCGPHARFAEVRGRARRYAADVAPFFGMPSPPSAQDWRDAGTLFAPDTYAAVWLDDGGLPEDWRAVMEFDLVQMVGERVTGAECPRAVPLGAADVAEMLELVAETEPGPFLPRTVELGDYLGIRDGGELVAMAGERFRVEGWTEISAVCTRPEPSRPGACLTAHRRPRGRHPVPLGGGVPARPREQHRGDPALRTAGLPRQAGRQDHGRRAGRGG